MLSANIGLLLFVLVCLLIVGASIYQRRSKVGVSGLIPELRASGNRKSGRFDFSESPEYMEKTYVEFTTDEHGNVLPDKAAKDASSFWVRVAVSGLVLIAALFIILSRKFPADQEKWAFGVIGTILGYWLKV